MQRTIWYGSKNNEPVFAENQQVLTNNGIDNPRSFTVSGEVTGLKLISEQTTQQSGSAQHA